MATSGSVNFSTNRDEIIKQALLNIGIISEGQTPNPQTITDISVILNMVVKYWNAKIGLPLWALKTGYILPTTGVNTLTYTSHCVNSYTQTTLSADSAANDTTLTVTSITGISDTYVIGIELDSGDIDWTTVNGSPSGSTVTITTGVTSAASSGNVVYAYSTSNVITRPLRVVHAYTHDVTSNNDTPATIITHQEYVSIGTKTGEAYPTQLYYDPQLSSSFYWYPRWANGDRVMVIRYHRPFEDFDASSDEPDFPQEWYLPLLSYLTWMICGKYGIPIEIRREWRTEALALFNDASFNDQEEGSVFFQPASASTRR